MDMIAIILSIITIIVFFVMANNIGTLVTINRALNVQNAKIIDILTRMLPSDKLTNEEKAKILK